LIFESQYWKDDLRKIGARILKRKGQTRWIARSFVALEKDVFVGFYAIRKLVEAKKLSVTIETMQIDVTTYSSTEKGVTRLNSHRLDEHYDFTSPSQGQVPILLMCNQVIHSYIFTGYFNDDYTLGGIFVTSDHSRKQKLYAVEVDALIMLFETVATDDPVEMHSIFDPSIGDYGVTLHSTYQRHRDHEADK